jgi:hypothetical protein
MTATQTLTAHGRLVRKGAVGALLAAMMVTATAPASAHHKPGHHKGPHHRQPPVVYVQPQPVYVAPAPVTVIQPAPVVIAPQPVYVAPPPPVYTEPSIDIVFPIHIE